MPAFDTAILGAKAGTARHQMYQILHRNAPKASANDIIATANLGASVVDDYHNNKKKQADDKYKQEVEFWKVDPELGGEVKDDKSDDSDKD